MKYTCLSEMSHEDRVSGTNGRGAEKTLDVPDLWPSSHVARRVLLSLLSWLDRHSPVLLSPKLVMGEGGRDPPRCLWTLPTRLPQGVLLLVKLFLVQKPTFQPLLRPSTVLGFPPGTDAQKQARGLGDTPVSTPTSRTHLPPLRRT